MRVPQRIAISGSSGLIGTALVGHLKSEGHTVQRLVRRAPVAADEVQWDPQTGFVDLEPLRGVDAVIHLAGVGVGDKRWSKKYKSEILNSRLLGTTAIATSLHQGAENPLEQAVREFFILRVFTLLNVIQNNHIRS